jgi:O-antigen/teichoic acid export membrane protein
MAISAIAYVLMQSVDIILLSKFTDFKMVAFYSVALKLTAMISLVLASVNTVQAPKIAELFSLENYEKLDLLIRQSTRLILVITLPGIILLLFLSNFILSFFGQDYVIAQTALLILLVGQCVNALCGSVGVYMNMTGRQNVLQKILLLAFIVNLILNWILIPLYGINGAAIATSFSMILWKVITVVYIYKKDKIKTFFTFR